ncbi:hypothetical protein ACN38_g13236, partial [Penicillium nordicum]
MNDLDPPSKPRRSTTLTSLTVAGFAASGQSADWLQPLRIPPSKNDIPQSDRGGLRLQDNRQTG